MPTTLAVAPRAIVYDVRSTPRHALHPRNDTPRRRMIRQARSTAWRDTLIAGTDVDYLGRQTGPGTATVVCSRCPMAVPGHDAQADADGYPVCSTCRSNAAAPRDRQDPQTAPPRPTTYLDGIPVVGLGDGVTRLALERYLPPQLRPDHGVRLERVDDPDPTTRHSYAAVEFDDAELIAAELGDDGSRLADVTAAAAAGNATGLDDESLLLTEDDERLAAAVAAYRAGGMAAYRASAGEEADEAVQEWRRKHAAGK